MDQKPFEYIKQYYKVPAEFGREVLYAGKRKGIIVEDQGGHIGVTWDEDKPGTVYTLHPTSELEYLGIGKIRPVSRGKQRYRDYLRGDYSCTFAEFLGIKKKAKYSHL